LMEGVRNIKNGSVPVALVGGCDTKVHSQALLFLSQVGLLKGLDNSHDFSPGEGAGVLLLGAKGSIKISGVVQHHYGTTRGFLADPEKPRKVLQELLQTENVGSIDAVVTSKNGHPWQEACEGPVLDEVFGSSCPRIDPGILYGETFAAAFAIKLAHACEVMEKEGFGKVVVTSLSNGDHPGAVLLERS